MTANAPKAPSSSPSHLSKDDTVQILGEIVGGYQLAGEKEGSDLKERELRPYCIVKYGNKPIHYTNPCSDKGSDPIWTVSTGSLFLIKVSPHTLLRDKLEVSIWTKRKLDALQRAVLVTDTFFLGKASVDGRTILSNCKEQRLELQLQDFQGNEKGTESTVALRFRLASPSDLRLLELLREQGISPPTAPPGTKQITKRIEGNPDEKNPIEDVILREGSDLPIAPLVTETEETKLVVENLVDSFSFAFKTKTKFDNDTGLRKVRIKPGPDPTRVQKTKFLSPLELSKETLKPSQNWVEAGSGNLGTLHLEILSCHDLPNVDVGEAVGNLSDCFVCAVFEDCMVQTPVIDDELSPHWMPWTQRAFRFSIVHPMSTLYLGVLDYDLGPGTHEPIGRAVVNLTNLHHNVEYTLKYNLYPSSNLTDRESNGSIKIRLRIEYPDEKAALLASLQPRPQFHVNTRRSKTFKVVRYTCFGEYDNEEQFSWPVTKTYIFELLEYWRNLKFYLGECFWSLVFWRDDQVQVGSVRLPIHSALLFITGSILVERPSMIVPFSLLFISWILLAAMIHRLENPSPWKACTSFLDYLEILATGKAPQFKKDWILPCEYLKVAEEYEEKLKKRREEYQNDLDTRWAREEKLMTIGNENIHTEVANQLIPVELLEKLGRYQGILGGICIKLRVVKSVITWEDSIVSFWISVACLASGLVTLILPWGFLLPWIGRIIVWGFLGPHMRFVDIYLKTMSEKDVKALEAFREQSREARIRREEARKLKDMKCLAYGKYVTLIPGFNLPRHYDVPLHESFARRVPLHEAKDIAPATARIPGQQLYGPMIPQTKAGFSARQEGVEISKEQLLALEERISRLESIENHLSSRTLQDLLDNELPEDLGYEVNLFTDESENCEDGNQEQKTDRMPKEYNFTFSLSQTGFRAGNEQEELITYHHKWEGEESEPESVGKDHITMEDEKNDDQSLHPQKSAEAFESSMFQSPLQKLSNQDELHFMTPPEEEEEKKTDNLIECKNNDSGDNGDFLALLDQVLQCNMLQVIRGY